jgi:hypothetical protein
MAGFMRMLRKRSEQRRVEAMAELYRTLAFLM